MDEWREWLPETDLARLTRYDAQGIRFVWREAADPYHGAMRLKVEAWSGGTLLAHSDPVPPGQDPNVIRGCVRQLLVRVGTQLRVSAGG